MTENLKNPSKFCLYFERKQAIFEMMQRGEIDAKKYKVLQEKTLASTKKYFNSNEVKSSNNVLRWIYST